MPYIKNLSVAGSNNRLMATDIFYPEKSGKYPVVLYLHGFNGFKDWGNFDIIAERWAHAGFIFVKFNFSHNGTSPEVPDELHDLDAYGQNNYSKECFDTQQVLNFIVGSEFPLKEHINHHRIWLLGHSRGGGIAITQSLDERIYGLITWASVAELKTPWGAYSPEKMAQWKQDGVVYYKNQRIGIDYPLYYQLYEDYVQHQNAFDIEQILRSMNKPLLICHGSQDAAVSVDKATVLKSFSPHATLFIVASDHVFGRKHPAPDNALPEAMEKVLMRSIAFCLENQD